MNAHAARWWSPEAGGRVDCRLCPRACRIAQGRRGACGVRLNEGGALVTEAWGTSGLAVDPIEKKPLYHVLPGRTVLSFGTKGCNLDCAFCQNAHLSDPPPDLRLQEAAPAALARLALDQGCAGVAFTYNEPVISAEYVLEVAAACREAGLRTVAVTNGYVSLEARAPFFAVMDAANVDLKAFTDRFYRERCDGALAPVLETLEHLAASATWLEVTTLLIPGLNDGRDELEAMARWFIGHLGPDVPWHFSAFHPAHRLLDRPPTPAATLHLARDLAREIGVRHVYLGNLPDPTGSATSCPACGETLIRRSGFRVLGTPRDRCTCGRALPGVFA